MQTGWFAKSLKKDHLQNQAGDREATRGNTVPRTGNSGAPYTPGPGNLPIFPTPEECREDHLIEAWPYSQATMTLKLKPGYQRPDPTLLTLDFPLVLPNQMSEGKEATHFCSPYGSTSWAWTGTTTAACTWTLNEWGFTEPVIILFHRKGIPVQKTQITL